MNTEDRILDAMKKESKPLSAGQIADIAKIERKEVDKAMNVMKKDGRIVSPKRCYWEPK